MVDVCKNGHVDPPRRANGNCKPCEQERYAKDAVHRERTRKASKARSKDPVRGPKHRAYMKEYAIENREKLREQARARDAAGYGLIRRLRRKGLSEELIEQIKDHPGTCDLCSSEPDGRWNSLYIDHCHETGVYRGMLCGKCNKGLGLFRDDPSLLHKAANYLIQYRKLIPNEHA